MGTREDLKIVEKNCAESGCLTSYAIARTRKNFVLEKYSNFQNIIPSLYGYRKKLYLKIMLKNCIQRRVSYREKKRN